MRFGLAGAALATAMLLAPATAPARASSIVERVVLVMRHGVRPPTKNPPMPAGIAVDPWPAWPVAPGWLTPHGAEAVRLLGAADRRRLAATGLLPHVGCPEAGAVAIVSDSDQRTIATGDAWAEGLAPGCRIDNQHKPQDDPDPLFSPIAAGNAEFDPARADRAVQAALGPGGVAAADRRKRTALAAIDRIYCGRRASGCGVTAVPSGLATAGPGRKPKLTGALDLGSTAAQILLLQYAEGLPMTEVGWGRATAADIALVGSLHSTEFAILARPPYMAAQNIGPIAARIVAALAHDAPKLTVLVGHDTNIASLAGLLDVHWRVPGFAADDPAPGGALEFELLRDSDGRRSVRLFYRSQSLAQLRSLGRAAPFRRVIALPGCGGRRSCPLERFAGLLRMVATD